MLPLNYVDENELCRKMNLINLCKSITMLKLRNDYTEIQIVPSTIFVNSSTLHINISFGYCNTCI